MKYGILGDIHSNLTALRAVLEKMDEASIDTLISVGDVVGYGGAPSECIALLRERGAVVVKGNHDAACINELDERTFNPYARAAVAWTRTKLSAEEKRWLKGLPLVATLEHCQVAHGTLHRPELFDYILSLSDADPSLDEMTRPVCFVGHSHIPLTVMRFKDEPERTAYTCDAEIDLADTCKALINVGSVGQPRDENPDTAYALFDATSMRASILRIPYDIEVEVARILDAGLPQVLGERLRLGI
ncbi:MAG: metallophosphoesterase family protein [Planctomycetes bacterium]|nr:metallophosphoesterase family protein [Planctomycetota bacterium]